MDESIVINSVLNGWIIYHQINEESRDYVARNNVELLSIVQNIVNTVPVEED